MSIQNSFVGHQLSHRLRSLALIVAMGIGSMSVTHAEMLDPATIKKGDVGPITPYGETAAEAAAKKTMYLWLYTNAVERNPQKAFETYVSKSYCNHGHLSTGGQKDCSDYQETVTRWINNYGKPLKPGEKIEWPTLASVNGEMVTMYGEGVDIFRVVNGKITDHWDASPPAAVMIKAHTKEFTDRMVRTVAGEKGLSMAPVAPAATPTPAPAK